MENFFRAISINSRYLLLKRSEPTDFPDEFRRQWKSWRNDIYFPFFFFRENEGNRPRRTIGLFRLKLFHWIISNGMGNVARESLRAARGDDRRSSWLRPNKKIASYTAREFSLFRSPALCTFQTFPPFPSRVSRASRHYNGNFPSTHHRRTANTNLPFTEISTLCALGTCKQRRRSSE